MERIGTYQGLFAWYFEDWDSYDNFNGKGSKYLFFGPEGLLIHDDRVVGKYRKSFGSFQVLEFDLKHGTVLKRKKKIALTSGGEEEFKNSDLDAYLQEALTGMVIGGIDLRSIG